jgi:uncharacterized protein (TIGR01244 family)
MFRQLTDAVLVSPQISVEDVARAKAAGVTFILNNRPEGESPDQTAGDAIEAAARDAGIGYAAVADQPQRLCAVATRRDGRRAGEVSEGGRLLAYCRSGTRSTLLWALSRARAGDLAGGTSEGGGAVSVRHLPNSYML